jgi:hypothetical protein
VGVPVRTDGHACEFPQWPVVATLLRYFRNLESLFLNGWYLTRRNPEQLSAYFCHFGETVTYLKLEGEASSDSLIYLASMFPRLSALEIGITRVLPEWTGTISRKELPTTGSFQGCLYLWGLSKNIKPSSSSSHLPPRGSIRSASMIAKYVIEWGNHLTLLPLPLSRWDYTLTRMTRVVSSRVL